MSPDFKFLHFSNDSLLLKDMVLCASRLVASKTLSGKYDLIVIDNPKEVPLVCDFLEQHANRKIKIF